jgi:hypothetical protein
MIIPLCAVGFLVWTNYERARRVDYVTNTDSEDAAVDATSPTGYADGKRWLIVPEHNNRSYQWIAETQQMLARREWRMRHVDYDNAPFGREVHSASLYRWWLGLIAWCDHLISGRPAGLSVERAALLADPLLHVLLLVGATVFVARCIGVFPAALLALGVATIYPFAGGFLPGGPDAHGLAWACSLWSLLPLLAGIGRPHAPAAVSKGGTAAIEAARACRRARRLFFIAGVAGGLGLWVSAANQTPVLLGIALGGFLASWIEWGEAKVQPSEPQGIAPWRTWALGGAVTCLAAYLVEYFPAHLDLRLQVNHPFYGLAWIGVGELLALAGSWAKQGKWFWNRRQAAMWVIATVFVAALPVAMVLSGTPSLFAGDEFASRLSFLPDGAVARNFLAWIVRDGFTVAVGATCLPLLLLGPALWLLARHKMAVWQRTRIALAVGPVLVALTLACFQLRWWNLCDSMLLVLLVAAAAENSPRVRWVWSGFAGLVFLPGFLQLVPPVAADGKIAFTRLEVEGLIERALAHWIADHAGPGGAIILVPPDRTTSWCFHGGLRGLGSANWENRDGLEATVRIVTATTANEALALISQRGVTHLILPSWDSDLDEFARWTLRNPEDAFIMALHHWALPLWLRPVPYKLPAVAGFEGQSVVILEVTDESNRAASLGRLAEYFIETQQLDLAASVSQVLQRYPTDLGALVALAQVEKARGDGEDFAKTFNVLLSGVAGGSDRILPWDRRLSLSIVLAQGGRNDLAREQMQRCLEKLDETQIRSLTTGSLFRLQVLSRAFAMEISDQRLRKLALALLPAELRNRL